MPLVVSFPRRQLAVHDSESVLAEAADKMLHDLIRQRDLRHQHDRGFVQLQTFVDRFHVNFRLAAGCHAMQQKNFMS